MGSSSFSLVVNKVISRTLYFRKRGKSSSQIYGVQYMNLRHIFLRMDNLRLRLAEKIYL